MTAHPNRSRQARRNPTPADIKNARSRAGITQAEAAGLLHADLRSWQKWEGGERSMHPAFWELLTLKIAALAQGAE